MSVSRQITVWAERLQDIHLNTAEDARLRVQGDEDQLCQEGNFADCTATHGQAGWDLGMQFTSFDDLGEKLNTNPVKLPKSIYVALGEDESVPTLKPGSVDRIAIHCHGLPGMIFVNGMTKKPMTHWNWNDAHFSKGLEGIKKAVPEEKGFIYFMCCLVAQGEGGALLLKDLSTYFGNRFVIAYITVGYNNSGYMARSGGGGKTECGMRVTDSDSWADSSTRAMRDKQYDADWADLTKLPWATHKTPKWTKVYRAGKLLKGVDNTPENEYAVTPIDTSAWPW